MNLIPANLLTQPNIEKQLINELNIRKLNPDLTITRFGYKGKNYSNLKGKVLMWDVGGVDILFRQVPATFLTAKTEYYLNNKFKYKKVFPIGSLQFDEIFQLQQSPVSRDEFCKAYNINPQKKLVILTPANPGEGWMPGIQEDYKQIVKIIEANKEYQLLIKGHPLDYALTKAQHYQGKSSWEVIAPQAKIVKPEEGYKALSICDLVVNIRSSIAMEVPLFYKPLINVNSDKYLVNWKKDKCMNFIQLKELGDILQSPPIVNKQACDIYTNEYVDKYKDGLCYKRMADIIQNL